MNRMTRAAFAKLCGVSKQAIMRSAKEGSLKSAMIDGKLDLTHPAVIKYATGKGVDLGSHTTPDPRIRTNTGGRRADRKIDDGRLNDLDIPEDILEYADKPFKEIVAIFATDNRFVDWLKALKIMQEIDGKKIQNRQLQKELISRELAQKHIFAYMSATNEKLLQDAPLTIALKAQTLVKAGESVENIKTQIHDLLSSYIKTAKAEVKRGLRKL